MRSTQSIVAGAVLRLTLVFLTAACVAQNNPAPVIFQPLTPDHIAPAVGNPVTLTVRGANFVTTSVVNWNGSPRTTTYVSKTSLHAVINAADVAATGTGAVSVTNPAPGGGTSNVLYLPIHRPQTTVALAEHDYAEDVSNEGPVQAGAVGDFNQDGHPDFAFVNTNTSTIDVLPGNGTGSFGAAISTPATLLPTNLIMGDFNGDGKLDLFGWNLEQEGTAVVFLGNGDGTFTQLPSVLMNGASFAVGDFNRDGKLDLVTVTTGGVAVSFGNGDGTFGAQTVIYKYKFDSILYDPIVGEFNGDGILDIAIVEHVDSSTGEYYALDMFEGKGDGTFYTTKPTILPNVFTNGAVGDINHDGKLDIVGNFGVLLTGNGNGTFNIGSAIASVSDVQLVDMNNDGNLDIVGYGSMANNFPAISVQLGNGDGTFQPAQTWSAQAPGNWSQMGVADWNSDGLLDAAFETESFVHATSFSTYLQTGLNISPTLIDFGKVTVGTSASPQTITLTNTTAGTLKIEALKTAGAVLQFSYTTTCGATLAAGANCTITAVFSPNEVRDGLDATIEVVYNQLTGPQYIELLGESTN